MRLKLMIVFSSIICVLGVAFSAFTVSVAEQSAQAPKEQQWRAQQAVQVARLQWQADAVQRERWLQQRVQESWVKDVFLAGTEQARAHAASAAANRLVETWRSAGEHSGPECTLALFVDPAAVSLGRNHATMLRGENLAPRLGGLLQRARPGQPVSGVWFSPERQEQMFVSVAAVSGEGGQLLGAVVVGTPITDEAVARVSQLSLGAPLSVISVRAQQVHLLAKYRAPALDADAALLARWNLVDLAGRASKSPHVELQAAGETEVWPVAAAVLSTTPEVWPATPSVVAAEAAPSAATTVRGDEVPLGDVVVLGWVEGKPKFAWLRWLGPVWGIVLLGLAAAITASFLFGAYFSRPIAELEDGLLQVINGDERMRFDLDHQELGPLVSRVNTLLDSLAGQRPKTAQAGAAPQGLED